MNKLEKINSEIEKCEKCKLQETRKNPVPGQGNPDAKIMFIGEAPGREEDLQGKPFVGKAGKILDTLLNSVNLTRKDIFIANILKCRPPKNRNPKQGEIKACSNYLDKQIGIINPKVIACLGNFSAKYILEKYGLKGKIEGISKIKCKIFKVSTLSGEINIIPLYHPAVAVYDPKKIKDLKKDFQILRKFAIPKDI